MQKILVIKLSALGDFVLALPAMAAIRRHHQGAHITLLTTALFYDLATATGYFDAIIVDQKPKFHDVKGLMLLRQKLNAQRYDRVYDLQLNSRVQKYRWLFKSPKPEWSGIHPKGKDLAWREKNWRAVHAFERHRQILRLAGIEIDDAPPSWLQNIPSAFSLQKPYVLLMAGSAPQHLSKRWSVKKYIALAVKLSHMGYQPVLIGTQAEQDITSAIASYCPEVKNLTGQTSLFDITLLAQEAAAVIGNDTGPIHLAAYAGAPVIVLFGPFSNPAQSAPRGLVRVIKADDINEINLIDVLKVFDEIKRDGQ